MKLLIFSTLLLLPYFSFCQHSVTENPNQLKISVIRPLNILNPGVEISYERAFSDQFSTQLIAGIATNTIGKPFKNLSGYNIGLEEKYFIAKKENNRRYFSAIINYGNIRYKELTTGKDDLTGATINDTFTIARKSISLAVKYGIQYDRKRFVFDLNFGVGIKYRSVKHYDRIFEYPGPKEPTDLFRAANTEKEGLAFHLPVNLQIGYRF